MKQERSSSSSSDGEHVTLRMGKTVRMKRWREADGHG